MTDKIVVLVTCASAREAEKIGHALVEQGLAACANVIQSPVKSVYRWKGRIESAREFLMVVKTVRSRFVSLERTIKELHSYDVPEILALPVVAGSRSYLEWISESIGIPGPTIRKRA